MVFRQQSNMSGGKGNGGKGRDQGVRKRAERSDLLGSVISTCLEDRNPCGLRSRAVDLRLRDRNKELDPRI